jgi:hypothetical protein
MPEPLIVPMFYPPNSLRNWGKKDYSMLTSSTASDYLKAILFDKVTKRCNGRRFFGEAYVAAKIEHRHGYYGSFKWVTNPRFSNYRPFPKGPTKQYKEELRTALFKHFGKRQIEKLQRHAMDITNATGVRPVATDLWLVDRQGNHRFIEVKLPNDRVRPQQLKGMYLISSCLRVNTQLSVEIVELRPEHELTSQKHTKNPKGGLTTSH